MRMERPKVGILFLAHEWFWNYKMFGPDFLKLIESDVASIERNLRSFVDVVSSGLVLNEDQAIRAAREFGREGINLLIICSIVWSSDQPLLTALREISAELPLLVWCYNPYEKLPERMSVSEMIRATGTVGTLQTTGAIRRLGRDFVFVIGKEDDEEVLKDIYGYSVATKLADDLKRTKIGLLPYRYGAMTNMWVDEFKLLSKIGPKVEPISVTELHQASQQLDEAEVDSFVEYLKKNFEIVDVSEKSLRISAKASLGLAKIVEQHSLDAIAIEDLNDELHNVMKTRPCLYVKSMFEKGVAVGMEGDICATISVMILQRLTGKPAMFSEIFTFDSTSNTLLMGHIGMLNVNVAKDMSKVKIIPDCEYKSYDEVEGAFMYFTAKEGRVTLFSIVNELDTYRMIVAKGESLPINEKLEGYSHMLVKPDVPIKRFLQMALKSGATQHWAVVHEDVVADLEKLADVMGLEKTLII